MVCGIDGSVTVCLPVALIAVGIRYCSLDMVRVRAELRRYGSPVPLGYGMTVKAGGSSPLGGRVVVAVAALAGEVIGRFDAVVA